MSEKEQGKERIKRRNAQTIAKNGAKERTNEEMNERPKKGASKQHDIAGHQGWAIECQGA